MHTNFEGKIGRIVDDELIWERPRTRREVGVSRVTAILAFGAVAALPLAIALIFILT